MRFFFLAMLVLAFSTCLAQDWAKTRLDASPRHQEWVDLKSGSRALKAFVVYPERKEKAPVVVIIHEIMGMTEWVQTVADRLAEKGYIAIAPDFLSGMGPQGGRTDSFGDLGKIREAISGLPGAQVMGDLDAAVQYARTIPAANGKVAVGGFCWGGTQTFNYAMHNPTIDGAFVFYGTGPSTKEDLAKIGSPVYGFFGGNDNRVNATISATEKAAKEAGKKFEPVTYDGAGHGFMRAGEAPGASSENKAAMESAWKRFLALLSILNE